LSNNAADKLKNTWSYPPSVSGLNLSSMKKYKQLTVAQIHQIEALIQAGFNR